MRLTRCVCSFNCLLPVFSCKQFAECSSHDGKCECPPGFGGDNCLSPRMFLSYEQRLGSRGGVLANVATKSVGHLEVTTIVPSKATTNVNAMKAGLESIAMFAKRTGRATVLCPRGRAACATSRGLL